MAFEAHPNPGQIDSHYVEPPHDGNFVVGPFPATRNAIRSERLAALEKLNTIIGKAGEAFGRSVAKTVQLSDEAAARAVRRLGEFNSKHPIFTPAAVATGVYESIMIGLGATGVLDVNTAGALAMTPWLGWMISVPAVVNSFSKTSPSEPASQIKMLPTPRQNRNHAIHVERAKKRIGVPLSRRQPHI